LNFSHTDVFNSIGFQIAASSFQGGNQTGRLPLDLFVGGAKSPTERRGGHPERLIGVLFYFY
jgi:hypothetical protein